MSSFQPCHSFPGHVDHNSSLTFFYIYLYIFLYEICFFSKLEKKDPESLRRGGLLTSPKLAVCLGVQQKKVSGVFFVKSVFMSLIIYLSRGAPPTLGSIRSRSPAASRFVSISLFGERWRGRGSSSGGGRVEGDVISSVYGVVSQRHPVAPARPGLTPPHIGDGAPE